MIPEKACIKCGVVKAPSEFDLTKTGVSGRCKDCRRAYMRAAAAKEREQRPEKSRARALAHYHRNRDVYVEKMRVRGASLRRPDPEQLSCKECGKQKPVIEFQRANARGKRYTLICNQCFDPRANIRRRKARVKGAKGSFTMNDIRLKRDFQGGKCYYCQQDLVSEHIEHKIPISRGGTNWPANLALACQRCNLRKHNKTPAEFRAYLASST